MKFSIVDRDGTITRIPLGEPAMATDDIRGFTVDGKMIEPKLANADGFFYFEEPVALVRVVEDENGERRVV